MYITKHIKAVGKHVLEAVFNEAVYREFRVCFTIVKYENEIFSLCEPPKEFINAFCLSKPIFFSQDSYN